MRPVARATRVDEESGQRAVRLLLRSTRRQVDGGVRFAANLLQEGGHVIGAGCELLKKLARSHHHLIGGFAPAGAPTHAVGNQTDNAAGDARVSKQPHLVLLIFAVAAMLAGGSAEAVAFFHRFGRRGRLGRRFGVVWHG